MKMPKALGTGWEIQLPVPAPLPLSAPNLASPGWGSWPWTQATSAKRGRTVV